MISPQTVSHLIQQFPCKLLITRIHSYRRNPSSLQIAYYDTTQNAWVTIPSTVNTAHNYILAQISHFTIYAVTYGVKVITPASTTTTTTTITLPPVVTTTPLTTTHHNHYADRHHYHSDSDHHDNDATCNYDEANNDIGPSNL